MLSLKNLCFLAALLPHASTVEAAPALEGSSLAPSHHMPTKASKFFPSEKGDRDGNHDCGHNGCDDNHDHGDNDKGTATVTKTAWHDSNPKELAKTVTITITTVNPSATTVTETDTVIQTTSDCTATATDDTTIVTPGPTVTVTVTEPGETTTETISITSVETTTDTTTITEEQVIAETQTETETDTQFQTTTETQTSTVTQDVSMTVIVDNCDPTDTPGPAPDTDYGSCSDPSISYEFNGYEYVFTTVNQADFPFGESPTIQSPAALICNRLQSPCNAPAETVARCQAVLFVVSSLSGQEAADRWNELMA
ncbi:hypothetical protein BDW62DRAFT_209624 [Aspergillus aurantiobrunneus]